MRIEADHLEFDAGGLRRRLHHVWLRDNCGCSECRVTSTGERKLFTADIPDDIRAIDARLVGSGDLDVEWSDGHHSTYAASWLDAFDYSNPPPNIDEVVLWESDFEIPRFAHDALFEEDAEMLGYLDALHMFGAAIVEGVPDEEDEVERFCNSIGHLREVAFERVHNVFHDPRGYNVAHTPLELKPHSDMPSYHWPPSVQLLHFRRNRAAGGESTLVDGWNALGILRAEDPVAFNTLATVPVTFQLFSEKEDTKATSPMVQLDTEGRVRLFRFSNQLALPVQVEFDRMSEFYRAYRALGRIIDSDRSKVVFKAKDRDLVTVHGHRVLHGRLPFEPGTGERHLQDVYMEFDDLMARRRVAMGIHIPQSPAPVRSS